jgi:hypothetical protein
MDFFFEKFISSSLNLSDYILFPEFLVPEKATQLAYTLFSAPRDGKLSKEKLPEVLETEKETHHTKTHFQTYT